MTDKQVLTEMLTRAGYKIDPSMWILRDVDMTSLGIESEYGSVGFSFDAEGKLRQVWGRDW